MPGDPSQSSAHPRSLTEAPRDGSKERKRRGAGSGCVFAGFPGLPQHGLLARKHQQAVGKAACS